MNYPTCPSFGLQLHLCLTTYCCVYLHSAGTTRGVVPLQLLPFSPSLPLSYNSSTKVTVGSDGICWVITKWIAHSTVASESSLPFEFCFAAKQEWPNGDEERVECAIHFVITQQIPSEPTVTLSSTLLQPSLGRSRVEEMYTATRGREGERGRGVARGLLLWERPM